MPSVAPCRSARNVLCRAAEAPWHRLTVRAPLSLRARPGSGNYKVITRLSYSGCDGRRARTRRLRYCADEIETMRWRSHVAYSKTFNGRLAKQKRFRRKKIQLNRIAGRPTEWSAGGARHGRVDCLPSLTHTEYCYSDNEINNSVEVRLFRIEP